MDSEDVFILGVDTSAELVCLGKKRAGAGDKGKGAADPSRRQLKKVRRDGGKQFESCLVILDDSNGSDYVEMYGGDMVVNKDAAGALTDKEASQDLECVVSVPKKLDSPADSTASALHGDSAAALTRLVVDEDLDLILTDVETKSTPAVFSSPSSTSLPTGTTTTATSSALTVDTSPYIPTHPLPTDCSSLPSSTSSNPDKRASNHNNKDTIQTASSDLMSKGSVLQRTPTCWTVCPNCPPNKKRKYHLIDVAYNCAEWSVVSNPLVQLGFTVTRVQRIQNEILWQRLCFEKQLMLSEQRSVNEQLLYHTSRCSVAIICEEGLDARLSMNGNFGRGMYFSDSPFKCNSYWSQGCSTSRYMFCCRVLLGDIKVYPKGRCEQLMREPAKVNPKPGEPKFFDSVQGNLSGQNEFVVYNNHRVMPEYVLEYTPCTTTSDSRLSAAASNSHMTNHFMSGPTVRLVAGVKHLFHPTGTTFAASIGWKKRRKTKKKW